MENKAKLRAALLAGMGVLLAGAAGCGLRAAGQPGSASPGNLPGASSSGIALGSEQAAAITLSPQGAAVTGAGARVEGDRVIISRGGEYLVTGSLPQGQLYIEAGGDDTVLLRLAGAEIFNGTDAAIHVENAGSTVLWLEAGSDNLIQSGTAPAEGVLAAEEDDDASGGAVYARDDLTVAGEGSLRVLGYQNNGIQSANRLSIQGGTLTVEARNNGVKGKDGVTVSGGSLDITAGGDGIKSDDTTGEGYGVVAVTGGELVIRASGDAVQAETALTVSGGTLDLLTGGGSRDVTFPREQGWGRPDSGWDMEEAAETSAKGLKSGGTLTVSGGTITADCRDDALHANGSVTVAGGEITAASGDDGIHADEALTVEAGQITVTRSYEGLEGNLVHIAGGQVDITADDDGINAWGGQSRAGDRGGSSKAAGAMPELRISGGTVTVDAGGDGLDSNGDLIVEGGLVLVNGPASSGNGALDYGAENGGRCLVNGGTVLALGSAGMAETFGEESGQCSFRYNFGTGFAAGDEIVITGSGGEELYRCTAAKAGSSVVFSAPALAQGETYTLRAGEQSAQITLTGVSTTAGTGGGTGGRPGGGRGGMGGQPPAGRPERLPGERAAP